MRASPPPGSVRASAAQLTALNSISTCDLSDAILRLPQAEGGQHVPGPHGGFLPNLQSFAQAGGFVGEAFTVQMVDAKDANAPKLQGHYVIPLSAMLGGLLATALAVKKVAGVAVDGRVRDLAELRALPLPILAKAHGTIGQSPFTRVSAVEVPVAWAGTTVIVNPFDVVVADEDGVVVLRPAIVDDVLDEVRKGQEADAKCLVDIQAGRKVADAFKEHRGKK